MIEPYKHNTDKKTARLKEYKLFKLYEIYKQKTLNLKSEYIIFGE